MGSTRKESNLVGMMHACVTVFGKCRGRYQLGHLLVLWAALGCGSGIPI